MKTSANAAAIGLVQRQQDHSSDSSDSHKYYPPVEVQRSIFRSRLHAQLDEHPRTVATIIHGPAGQGKTSLMQQLYQQRVSSGQRVGWLNLESSDNDISRFSACLKSLLLKTLRCDNAPTLLQQKFNNCISAADSFITLLDAGKEPITLFIDDLHKITEPINHSLLRLIIERVGINASFYIGTRSVPEFAKGRLVVNGKIRRIAPHELSFSESEVELFLNQAGISLADPDKRRLYQQSKGWPGAMQLFRLATQHRDVTSQSIPSRIEESDPTLAAYIDRNVMHELPKDTQQFLIVSSLPKKISEPLCRELTGSVNADKFLHDLVTGGLFITQMEKSSDWYQYHDFFREYLKRQFDRLESSYKTDLHQKASRWFFDQQMFEDALDHAISAKDFVLAIDILSQWLPDLIRTAQLQTAEKWFIQLPPETYSGRSQIALSRTWIQLFYHCRPRPILQRDAMHDIDSDPSQQILHKASMLIDDESDATRNLDTIEFDASVTTCFECFEMNALANLHAINSLQQGEIACAKEWARVGEALGERGLAPFSEAYATSLLALGMIQEGNLHHAIDRLNTALTTAAPTSPGSLALVPLRAVYGFALYEGGNYLQTVRQLEEGINVMSRTLPLGFLIPVYLCLTRAHLEIDQTNQKALDVVDEGERLGLTNRHPRLVQVMRRERIRIHLARGETAAAARLLKVEGSVTASPMPSGQVHLGESSDDSLVHEARLAIHFGNPQEIAPLLKSSIQTALETGWERRALKLKILTAMADYQLNQGRCDRASVAELLKYSADHGYISVWLEEGDVCANMLSSFEILSQDFLDQKTRLLLARLLASKVQPIATNNKRLVRTAAIAPRHPCLTKREAEVVELTAGGYSNKEVAERLFVSSNTVKFHLKNVYQKLGVKNRIQLIEQYQN